MGSLTLVGTIHRDPDGLPRLMEILERESPEIITLEMSEFGVVFRERNGPRLKEKLFDILRGLYGESIQREREKPFTASSRILGQGESSPFSPRRLTSSRCP